VKWLANELAAVAGELELVDEALRRLQARKERLLGVHAALSDVAGLLTVPELPAVVPAVRAHGRYGERGGLRAFLRELLQTAYPSALDTLALTEAAVQHFGLTFPNAEARSRYRDQSVATAMRRLHERGEVERLHDFRVTPNSVGAWRWKVDAPTLDELRGACSPETPEAPWR
jgi:hypothetical protein